MSIKVTTEGPNDFGLVEVLQRYADEFWLPEHATEE